jgi:hypothetical protein
MLISFTNEEVLNIGRAMAQGQEGLTSLFKYLERAVPVTAMHAVNTSGEQSEKFKGFALCLSMLRDEIRDTELKAQDVAKTEVLKKFDRPGHVLIS